MVTKLQLSYEEPWEVRRFQLWYMEATKAGLSSFVTKILVEYFHLPEDVELIVEFHEMCRLLWRDDLDDAQVTLFAL